MAPILAPVSAERPCGEDLRHDPVWDEVKAAHDGHTDAVDPSADVPPDWQTVQDLCSEVLATRSKDLQFASWLAESLAHLHGVAGFRTGLEILRRLSETYWDQLFPFVEDDGDMEIRASRIARLSSDDGARIPDVLRQAPLTPQEEDNDGGTLSFVYYQARVIRPQGPKEKKEDYERRARQSELRKDRFDAAVAAANVDFFVQLFREIEACKAEIAGLDQLLTERLGVDDAPSWSLVREALEDLEGVMRTIVRTKGGSLDPTPSATADVPGVTAEAAGPGSAADNGQARSSRNGPIVDRADAIRRLEEVAAYLRGSEPHSPVPALIDRAVRWARAPLSDVLKELVHDDKVMAQIREALGWKESES